MLTYKKGNESHIILIRARLIIFSGSNTTNHYKIRVIGTYFAVRDAINEII